MPPTHMHKDLAYFRLGLCNTCGEATYHKPVNGRSPSGREICLWQCEICGTDAHVLERVENEFELLAEYVRRTYFGQT